VRPCIRKNRPSKEECGKILLASHDLFARQQGHGTVLVVHGENDAIIPIRLGERLYGLVRAPKRFVSVAGAGHNDLGDDAVAAAKQFIADQ
jgi:fermentation-respiration switch protein FrsA (DUF1100 family)